MGVEERRLYFTPIDFTPLDYLSGVVVAKRMGELVVILQQNQNLATARALPMYVHLSLKPKLG